MDEIIQTGLRIPKNQRDRIKEHAERVGVSFNAMSLMLIDYGLTLFDLESDREKIRNRTSIWKEHTPQDY